MVEFLFTEDNNNSVDSEEQPSGWPQYQQYVK